METSPEIFSYECDPRRLFSSDQKSVLACGDAKRENWRRTKLCFRYMCPKPYSWAKNKRNFFF